MIKRKNNNPITKQKMSLTRNQYTSILLNSIVFTLIGVYCLLCAFFDANFACLHVFLFNTDVPIFIGEIVLGICLMLTMLKIRILNDDDQVDMWMALYFCCVVFLASCGYFYGGILALRNAAMLYYVIFSWMTYRCYSSRLFASLPLLLGLIVLILANGKINTYYWFTAIILLNILAIKTKKRWLIVTAIFFSVYQMSLLFCSSRSHLVAALIAFIFIIFLSMKHFFSLTKLLVVVGLILFLVVNFLIFSDRNAIHSLVSVQELISRYKEKQQYIDARKDHYKPKNLMIKAYRQEDVFTRKRIFESEDYFLRSQPVVSLDDVTRTTNLNDRSIRLADDDEILKLNLKIDNDDSEVSAAKRAIHNRDSVLGLRDIDTAYNNILFRYFIWRDMVKDWFNTNFLFGVGLGKPQRSPSIEILGWAYQEWANVGWITPHNYFLHIFYRLGILGIILILTLVKLFIYLTNIFIVQKDFVGFLLMGLILYWMIIAQFLVIFELPYYAILFWSLLGMTMAYAQDLKKRKIK